MKTILGKLLFFFVNFNKKNLKILKFILYFQYIPIKKNALGGGMEAAVIAGRLPYYTILTAKNSFRLGSQNFVNKLENFNKFYNFTKRSSTKKIHFDQKRILYSE